jgi:hypothetical protein
VVGYSSGAYENLHSTQRIVVFKEYLNIRWIGCYLSNYVYLSFYLSIYLSACLPTYLPNSLSAYLSICLPTYLPTNLTTYLRTCLSIYLFICLSAYLPTYLSTYLSICLSIYLSISDSAVLLLDLGCIFSFLILYTVGRIHWTGDQPVTRPLPTHRTTCLELDSNRRPQISSERRQFVP